MGARQTYRKNIRAGGGATAREAQSIVAGPFFVSEEEAIQGCDSGLVSRRGLEETATSPVS